jgi:uncharacterized delta-60 repeat protein
MKTLALTLAAALALAGCGGGGGESPPPDAVGPEFQWVERIWTFSYTQKNGTTTYDRSEQVGGVVDDRRQIGVTHIQPPSVSPTAELSVFSSETGSTYWVQSQVPATNPNASDRIEHTVTALNQNQYFIKEDDDATLSFTISQALVELMDSAPDFAPRAVRAEECVYSTLNDESGSICDYVVNGFLQLGVSAYNHDTAQHFFDRAAIAHMWGFQKNWKAEALTISRGLLWEDDPDFDFDNDVRANGLGEHARLRLSAPIVVNVPLAGVRRGEMFSLSSQAAARAIDLRNNRTYASAYLRDPQSSSGLELRYQGLRPVAPPAIRSPAFVNPPAPACTTAPNPAAGVLQFESVALSVGEGEQQFPVFVTRTGGSVGEVTALVASSDGSAVAGADYTAIAAHVGFADGQAGRRLVFVPLVADGVAEAAETVLLHLSDARGCATLGERTTAVLTILDDDNPPAAVSYTVGGTLTGLAGGSVRLSEVVTGSELTLASNGIFTFDRRQTSGGRYDVRVVTQPNNPIQVCTVSKGSGTLINANVVDVSVDCATPPPTTSGLDTSFGVAGKVTVGLPGGGKAVGLQRDGRLVVLGATGRSVVRYNADGSLDSGFGNAGTAPIAFGSSLVGGDEAKTLAIQPDDKILVAGSARFSGTDQRMAVARLNADGSVDAGFGNGGATLIDPYAGNVNVTVVASFSGAEKLLLQPDGKIVAVGWARFTPEDRVPRDNSYAALRLSADGKPDGAGPGPGFGGDGATTFPPNGIAYGVALQSDGMLVIAGRAGARADEPDVGTARLKTDGGLDTAGDLADRTPEMYGRDGSGFVVQGFAGWDEAAGLVMLANNHIVMAVQRQVGLNFQFTLLRLDDDGRFDTGGQIVSTPIGPLSDYSRALARQHDGKFVLVGQVSSGTVSDFGIVRYNADLTLDLSFGTNGVLLLDFFGASDGATDVVIQPDGKIVVVGVARNGTSNGLGMVRLIP